MRIFVRWLFIMIVKRTLNNRLKSAIFGVFFAVLSIFGFTTISAFVNPTDVYADPTDSATDYAFDSFFNPDSNSNNSSSGSNDNSNSSNSDNKNSNANGENDSSNNSNENESENKNENEGDKKTTDNCYDQVGALGWFICPGVGVLSKAIDSIYSQIETLLEINPVSVNDNSSIFYIWQIMRDITNILFVVVLLIVVYSQITGIGITNYGIKKALPKLIIAAVLVNLSYILCALAVDASNILGSSLRGLFDNIQIQAINAGGLSADAAQITWSDLATALIGGGVVAGFVVAASSLLFPILGALLCAIISVLIGLITIGLRQSLVSILIMISPLAFICYLLPNTEKWFGKWKDIFISMLIFYPMFSLLFGASRLAGWAMITSSIENNSAFGVAIGMVVQVLPLILSISLMKMSNTILGKASGALDKLASRPKEGIMAGAQKFRNLQHNRRINNSTMPSAHLQRYLDARNRKLELNTEYQDTIRKGRAEIWAQRRIQGIKNYDPAYDEEYKKGGVDKDGKKNRNNEPKANSSTRAAKEAMTVKMEAENAARNTAHILGNYGSYFNGNLRDATIANKAARGFMEYDRTLRVEENDNYADQDWLMGQYEKIRKAGEDSYAYKHYIVGGAGSLGKAGENLVLGEVIAKSAVNEAKRKNYTGLTLAKYGYDKTHARDMIVGYSVNDDGFAVDPVTRKPLSKYTDPKTGKTISIKERAYGEFLKYHPEYLEQSAYKLKDENGYYFNLKDKQGRFVSRIYKNDGAAMKEIFQNWDMPINDPINGLYGILTGVEPGEYKKKGYDSLGDVGLANFSTTLQRAMLSSGFKEKAAFASPLYATMIGNSSIKDFVHQNLARLDSLNKTTKPSNFNTQDSAEFAHLAQLMNPKNWDWMLFDEESLRSFESVNRQKLTGTRYKIDENGNYIKNADGSFAYDEIAADSKDLTFDDLKNTVIRKFLSPAGEKFASLMSRVTPNIIDNQKPGVNEPWNEVLDDLEYRWVDPETQALYPTLPNPMAERKNDSISRARDVQRAINPKRPSKSNTKNQPLDLTPGQEIPLNQPAGASTSPSTSYQRTAEDIALDQEYTDFERQFPWSMYASGTDEYRNHVNELEKIAAISGDTDIFINAARGYLDKNCATDERFNYILEDFNDYALNNKGDKSMTVADYKDFLIDLIGYRTLDE